MASVPNTVEQVSANPAEKLTPETLQQRYISFPEDPVAISSGVQSLQGLGASVEQWNGQPSHAISDFSPAGSKTSGLGQQVRTTSGLAAPPQFSPFIHSGLQRSFSTTEWHDSRDTNGSNSVCTISPFPDAFTWVPDSSAKHGPTRYWQGNNERTVSPAEFTTAFGLDKSIYRGSLPCNHINSDGDGKY